MPTFFVPWSPLRRSMTPNGQAGTQYPQPLQMSSCTTTVPNSVRNSDPVGHTSRQAACVQCLHTSDSISQRTSVRSPDVAPSSSEADGPVGNPLSPDSCPESRRGCSMKATCRHVLAPSAPVLSYDQPSRSNPSSGTPFHSLHATSHALQPMQTDVSVKNPMRGSGGHPASAATFGSGPYSWLPIPATQSRRRAVTDLVAAGCHPPSLVAFGGARKPVDRGAGAWKTAGRAASPRRCGWLRTNPSGPTRCRIGVFMTSKRKLARWPVVRQAAGPDRLGRGAAVRSARTAQHVPRTHTADRIVGSICPYCAVGCGQRVYVKDERVVQIEGDPDSPISRGRLCPKGSASLQLTTGSAREYRVRYRRPGGTDWEELELDTAMDMIADRVIATRKQFWEEEVNGQRVNRTMGIASLGGATLDNEENYLMKKLYTAMGAIQIENQARI